VSCDHVDAGKLLPYAEALAIVRRHAKPLGSLTVPLDEALGAWLTTPVAAPHPAPRFEQSAMDGYAVRLPDVTAASPDHAVVLELVGDMPAGGGDQLRLAPGQTVKVFTGSRLPVGTDAVVMKEFVTLEDQRAAMAWTVREGDHIRRVGEEFQAGDEILPAGTRVTPPVVGMLAFLGQATAVVGRRPTATVITMGDELVPPGAPAAAGQIHDANGPALVAALRASGLTDVRHLRVSDDPDTLRDAMATGLATSDILITAGGASVGDYDYVHGARQALGVSDLFTKIAIKPGKPNLFGLGPDGTLVFGLPGNPVSALVSFHQLVKPALVGLMGGPATAPLTVPARLSRDVRKKPGRLNWLRGVLGRPNDQLIHDQLTATPVSGQGSHMLSGLALADALIELDADSDGATAGDTTNAIVLDWNR